MLTRRRRRRPMCALLARRLATLFDSIVDELEKKSSNKIRPFRWAAFLVITDTQRTTTTHGRSLTHARPLVQTQKRRVTRRCHIQKRLREKHTHTYTSHTTVSIRNFDYIGAAHIGFFFFYATDAKRKWEESTLTLRLGIVSTAIDQSDGSESFGPHRTKRIGPRRLFFFFFRYFISPAGHFNSIHLTPRFFFFFFF